MSKYITDFLKNVAERFSHLMLLLGVILLLFGATGGLAFGSIFLGVNEDWQRYGLQATGGIFVVIAILLSLRKTYTLPDASKLDVRILNPRTYDEVGIIDVRGEIQGRVPKGYVLMLLRIYPDSGRGILPWSEVHLERDEMNWSVAKFNPGGSPGEKRVIGVYLVGPSGRALFRYFREAADSHKATTNKLIDLLKARVENLPLITVGDLPLIHELPPDVIKCAEVPIIRG